MYAIIGIVILLVLVFGGFVISGGAMGPVLHALPYEMMIIGGAAVGATIAGNSLAHLKAIGGAFMKIFKGPQHDKQDHIDAIALTTQLMKVLKTDGPVALESHVNEPENSTIFSAYPNLMKNHALISLISDTLTLLVVSSGTLETHAVEEVMDNAMKTHFHELHALGIVAAVLGVVKTMSSIDKPPEILGEMIGSALVGTFLGVLLAYGMVGPLATRLKQVIEQDEQIFHAVKQVIIASLYGHPQPLVVESARSSLGHTVRPGLTELLDALRGR